MARTLNPAALLLCATVFRDSVNSPPMRPFFKHVDAPEEVAVTETKGQHTSIVEPRVARGDVGKVISKEGPTAQSMRIILAGASTKLRRWSVLEIVD